MALITSRTQLNQGVETAVSDTVFSTGVGADIGLDSAGSNMPSLAVGEFFEIRGAVATGNNGLYVLVTINTDTMSYEADKVSVGTPIVESSVATTFLGATGTATEKSVMFDTAGLGVYLIEQGNLDANGVTGQAIYSFKMQEWKDDDFLIANGAFPILAIDSDAGKYILGQNAAGENTGWNWVDDSGNSIRTRKLVRDMGWDEVDANGITLARYVALVTLGTFEDATNDNAFYQFGTDTIIDDTVDFTFNGPVNEAVQFFERLADNAINQGTGVAMEVTGQTLTNGDTTNWDTFGVLTGFKVGGKIALRNCENSTNDSLSPATGVTPGYRIQSIVTTVMTLGTPVSGTTGEGYDFIDGSGGDDTLDRTNAGGSWISDGYFVGGNFIVSTAEVGANDGDYIITSITDTVIGVATASWDTATTDDNTVKFGPILDTDTPDILMDGSINNAASIRLGLRVRDGDPEGKTFQEANLLTVNKLEVGNFIFAFPLANATDLKITETDANIDANTPYTGMSITFHATPQVRAGLVGGSFNFGIIVDGNDGTNIEIFEFIQRQLRLLTDIDADADTAIGRTIGLLARFNGDLLEVGSGDGGLTFPVNPDGGGSGVFIDNVNAASANDVTFIDNLGVFRNNPETIAVTLDFNQTAIDDVLTEFDLFYDRTIRTAVSDFVMTTTAGGTITSAAVEMPNNAEIGVGSYIRVEGLTGGDAAMNGIYQITTETTPGADWIVVRYDGVTIVAVTGPDAVTMDQNVVDTPDAIIVHTNVLLSATTISYTSPDTMSDSANGFAIFAIGDVVETESTSGLNDGIREVLTVAAGVITFVEQDITTETAGAAGTVVVTKIASGLAAADFVFSYDFDGNVQGGRPTGPAGDTFVRAKAVGFDSAQYITSPVSTISSGTPLTIPLFAQTERNTA